MPTRHLGLQDYPRESSHIAKQTLFPKLHPPLDDYAIRQAVKAAFERMQRTRTGETVEVFDTPEKLVKACLKHLKEREDPVLASSFLASVNAKDVFELDAISYEMQRYRMSIGRFYQFLILELMKSSARQKDSHIIDASDGAREGDVNSTIKTPGFAQGLKLYLSVKKSSDTVGGQDLKDAMKRLETVAKNDQNRTSPYLCAVTVAGPWKGRVGAYEGSRQLKYDSSGNVFSWNCEMWRPGFIFPYVTGRSAKEIYATATKLVGDYLPFYSLRFKEKASELMKQELISRGIANRDGKMVVERLFDYMVADET